MKNIHKILLLITLFTLSLSQVYATTTPATIDNGGLIDEDAKMVNYYYDICLDRNPTGKEVTDWTAQIKKVGRLQVKKSICTSSAGLDYGRKIVRNLYDECLDRRPESNAVITYHWNKILANGANLDDVERSVCLSRESKIKSEDKYDETFKKATDDGLILLDTDEGAKKVDTTKRKLSKEESLQIVSNFFGKNSELYKLVEILISLNII